MSFNIKKPNILDRGDAQIIEVNDQGVPLTGKYDGLTLTRRTLKRAGYDTSKTYAVRPDNPDALYIISRGMVGPTVFVAEHRDILKRILVAEKREAEKTITKR